MDLSVTARATGAVSVVEALGELDLHTSPQMRFQLLDLASAGRDRIVVDLTGVSFLDSVALGVLVGAKKRAKLAGGDLALVFTQYNLIKTFRITGLHQVFDIHETVSDALTALEADVELPSPATAGL